MRKLALAVSVLVVTATAASAADMAAARVYTKAPPPAPVATWTGWYVGLNAGGAVNDSRDTVEPTGLFLVGATSVFNPLRTDSASLTGVGFTGGGQAGYNWQVDRTVFGIEADINYNGVNDVNSVNRVLAAPLVGSIIHSETDKIGWFGTVRGRLGWAVVPNFLLYGTGGLAYGQVRSASSVLFTSAGDTYVGSMDSTRVGWTAGAGGEWMIAPNWSVKAEYLYVDLGSSS